MARGKDNLYQRNGILCFRYKDVDGAWREKSTGERDRKQARAKKKKFEKKLEAGELPNEKSLQTVEQACTRWVAQHQTSGRKGGLKSSHGRKCEASYLRQLVKRLGNQKLKSITLDTLKDYQSSRKNGTDGSRPVQGRPINCELAILVSVLKEANLWSGELKNYSRLKEGEERVGNALTAAQKQLLEEVGGFEGRMDGCVFSLCARRQHGHERGGNQEAAPSPCRSRQPATHYRGRQN
jgi:hypothetical protein